MTGTAADCAAFDARAFRDALGHYASGITVVTSTHEDQPVGFTCQSFFSVSTDPPLVSFSVMRTSTTYPKIARAGRFCVNVLAQDQHRISSQFAMSGTDKWAGVAWSPSPSGNPVIEDTLLWVDCETWAEHEAGDHLIVVGRVVELSPPDRARSPLLYFRGGLLPSRRTRSSELRPQRRPTPHASGSRATGARAAGAAIS